MRRNLNKNVFSHRLNCLQPMSVCLRLAGRLFHSFLSAAVKHQPQKLWSPKVLQVHLTTHVLDKAERSRR